MGRRKLSDGSSTLSLLLPPQRKSGTQIYDIGGNTRKCKSKQMSTRDAAAAVDANTTANVHDQDALPEYFGLCAESSFVSVIARE